MADEGARPDPEVPKGFPTWLQPLDALYATGNLLLPDKRNTDSDGLLDTH